MEQTNTPLPTYTPTHTAEGRKLTRAERRAANKAKWASEQAARKPKASKRKAKAKPTRAERKAANKAAHAAMQAAKASERKPKGKQASKPAPAPMTQGLLDTWMFCAALGEAERKQASKPKRKPKPNSNDRMEARAQRESIRKQEDKRTKERAKATVVVGADGGDAQVCERRMEVPAPPKQERKPLTFDGPDFADFDGLTLTEAANLAKAHWMAEQEALAQEEGQLEMAL